jgi:hypothetical protein
MSREHFFQTANDYFSFGKDYKNNIYAREKNRPSTACFANGDYVNSVLKVRTLFALAISESVDNVDWKAARKIGDHILVSFTNANAACLSASAWITKYVPITIIQYQPSSFRSLRLNRAKNGGEENYTQVSVAKHIPGIYTTADICDIEKYVSRIIRRRQCLYVRLRCQSQTIIYR